MNVQRLRQTITMEHGLLLLFLSLATYMFVESFTFSERAAAFPRFTAGATIVGVLLLLFRAYLPGPIQQFVTDSSGAFEDLADADVDTESESELESDPESESAEGEKTPTEQKTAEPEAETSDDTAVEPREVDLKWITMNGTPFVGILSVLFVVLSYLIGMLWAAPIFVATYLAALRRPMKAIIGMAVLAFLLAYSFVLVLGIDIDRGVLLDLGSLL